MPWLLDFLTEASGEFTSSYGDSGDGPLGASRSRLEGPTAPSPPVHLFVVHDSIVRRKGADDGHLRESGDTQVQYAAPLSETITV